MSYASVHFTMLILNLVSCNCVYKEKKKIFSQFIDFLDVPWVLLKAAFDAFLSSVCYLI